MVMEVGFEVVREFGLIRRVKVFGILDLLIDKVKMLFNFNSFLELIID